MNEPGIHLFIGFQGVSLEEELKYLIRDYRPGGIVLFKRNIESREQLKNLVSERPGRSRWRNSSALSFLQSIKRAGASRGFRPTSVRSLRQALLQSKGPRRFPNGLQYVRQTSERSESR